MEYKKLIPEIYRIAQLKALNSDDMRIIGSAADAIATLVTENAALRQDNEHKDKELAAAVEDIKQACETCIHSKKPSCPWEGTYHRRGENGEKIGVCNAWQWRNLAGREAAE